MTRCVKTFTATAERAELICLLYYLQTSLQWLWCLCALCEVAFACGLADVDCIVMAEMSHTLGVLLENAAECFLQTPTSGAVAFFFMPFGRLQSAGQLKLLLFDLNLFDLALSHTCTPQRRTTTLMLFLFSSLISYSL